MCIRDSNETLRELDTFLDGELADETRAAIQSHLGGCMDCLCLLYTSDAADERSSVDLGGRRIIKKKKKPQYYVRKKATKNEKTHRAR